MTDINTYTTAEIANLTPQSGDLVLNTDDNAVQLWNGSAWKIFDSDVSPVFSEYSVEFDGTNDYMNYALDADLGGAIMPSSYSDYDLTFSFWVKPLTSSDENIFQWASVLTSGVPFMLISTQNSYVNRGFRSHSTNPTTNAWNHFLISRTASDNTWRVFLNGNSTPIASHNDGGTYGNGSNNGDLSAADKIWLANGYGGYGNVMIDEFAFWNSDQSANLTSIYNSGVPADLSSLTPYSWHRMGDNDSGTGTTITDQGVDSNGNPSGNDGTLMNGASVYSGTLDPDPDGAGPDFSSDVPS